jgi:hypothetical protein
MRRFNFVPSLSRFSPHQLFQACCNQFIPLQIFPSFDNQSILTGSVNWAILRNNENETRRNTQELHLKLFKSLICRGRGWENRGSGEGMIELSLLENFPSECSSDGHIFLSSGGCKECFSHCKK